MENPYYVTSRVIWHTTPLGSRHTSHHSVTGILWSTLATPSSPCSNPSYWAAGALLPLWEPISDDCLGHFLHPESAGLHQTQAVSCHTTAQRSSLLFTESKQHLRQRLLQPRPKSFSAPLSSLMLQASWMPWARAWALVPLLLLIPTSTPPCPLHPKEHIHSSEVNHLPPPGHCHPSSGWPRVPPVLAPTWMVASFLNSRCACWSAFSPSCTQRKLWLIFLAYTQFQKTNKTLFIEGKDSKFPCKTQYYKTVNFLSSIKMWIRLLEGSTW